MLLAEIDRLVSELNRALLMDDAPGIVAPLRRIGAIVTGIRAEIDIPVASTLGRHLAAVEQEAGALGESVLGRLQVAARPGQMPLSA
jgi:hypothetical protein